MFPLVVKVSPQNLQWKGRSPLWTSTWRSRLELELSTLWQIRQANPFSLAWSSPWLLCERMCSVKLCWDVSILSQMGHTYFRSGELQSLRLSLSQASMDVLVVVENIPESVRLLWLSSDSLVRLDSRGSSIAVTGTSDGWLLMASGDKIFVFKCVEMNRCLDPRSQKRTQTTACVWKNSIQFKTMCDRFKTRLGCRQVWHIHIGICRVALIWCGPIVFQNSR